MITWPDHVENLVRAELNPPTSLVDEDAIEVYHEPLYYQHYLVERVEIYVDGPVFCVC
jgi:hypothetical protein